MFTRLLVPLDGSKLSERALPHALQLSRIFRAQMVLLQVLDPSAATEEKPLIDPVSWKIHKAESEIYLQSVVKRLHEQEVQAEHHIVEGKTAETIVTFAQQENIDLLIMASHGQGGLSPWNISSVIQKVIHKIYLPILIVRAYQAPVEDSATLNYQKILIPLDSSKRAECSLSPAIAIAEAVQSQMMLLTVIRRPDIPFAGPHSIELSQIADRYMELSRSNIVPYLDELSQRIPVATEVRVVESDSVARSIHEVVEQEASDLVVFCAHGQTGHFEWPYGSIVYNFIEYGNCPVLIIQDIPPSRAKPTHAEIAASKYGSR